MEDLTKESINNGEKIENLEGKVLKDQRSLSRLLNGSPESFISTMNDIETNQMRFLSIKPLRRSIISKKIIQSEISFQVSSTSH